MFNFFFHYVKVHAIKQVPLELKCCPFTDFVAKNDDFCLYLTVKMVAQTLVILFLSEMLGGGGGRGGRFVVAIRYIEVF